jgi:hypothetical protein
MFDHRCAFAHKNQLNGVISRETDIARQLLKQGKRDKALLALKKKKYQENLLRTCVAFCCLNLMTSIVEKSEGQLRTVQEMVVLSVRGFSYDTFYI